MPENDNPELICVGAIAGAFGVRGEVRLRLDEQTAAVREVWIKRCSINERPLLPKLLERWVQEGATSAISSAAAAPAAEVARGLVAELQPWLV